MKEQDDCVVWLLGGRAASIQQGRRSDFGRQRGNAGCRLENTSQEAGSKRRSEKEEVQSENLDCEEERTLSDNYMKGGVNKLLRAGAWYQQEPEEFMQWR